jgi:hypothetical protein
LDEVYDLAFCFRVSHGCSPLPRAGSAIFVIW